MNSVLFHSEYSTGMSLSLKSWREKDSSEKEALSSAAVPGSAEEQVCKFRARKESFFFPGAARCPG